MQRGPSVQYIGGEKKRDGGGGDLWPAFVAVRRRRRVIPVWQHFMAVKQSSEQQRFESVSMAIILKLRTTYTCRQNLKRYKRYSKVAQARSDETLGRQRLAPKEERLSDTTPVLHSVLCSKHYSTTLISSYKSWAWNTRFLHSIGVYWHPRLQEAAALSKYLYRHVFQDIKAVFIYLRLQVVKPSSRYPTTNALTFFFSVNVNLHRHIVNVTNENKKGPS